MPEYGNFSSTPSMNSAVNSSTSDVNKQAFIAQANAWEGLAEEPGNPNGLSGSYRQIFNTAHIYETYDGPWCAAFVSACAKQAGISSIIPPNTWAWGIGQGIIDKGGKSIPGMASSWHCPVSPAPGDTVQFGSGGTVDSNGIPTQNNQNTVAHVGIVVSVDSANRKFTTIEGNSSDKVQRNTYSFDKSNIYYLARPNWEAVGGFSTPVVAQPHADGSATYVDANNIYVETSISSNPHYGITVYSDVRNGTPNDRHDMTIREIGYFSDRGTFTSNETDITISAINYTTMLGNLYDNFASYNPNGYRISTERLGGNVRVCVDYFGNKGLNPAASAGIAACIFVLSGIGTSNMGRGICGWEGKYGQDMRNRVPAWDTNLSGQLDYLWNDLKINYGIMLDIISNVPPTSNGARQAANRFMVSYRYTEAVQTIDEEVSKSNKAQGIASEWFSKIIITPNVPEGSTYSSPTVVTIPTPGTTNTITIDNISNVTNSSYSSPTVDYSNITLEAPGANVTWSFADCPYPQTGINTAFTSYSSWFNDWAPKSPQKKLANVWYNDWGRSCDRGIATINGCYLVAVAQTFGTIGTVLQVKLDNGKSFNALMADAKSTGDSNYTAWGHLVDGKVNVIEWEVVKVVGGVASTSGSRNAGYPPDLTGWAGANVVSITNLGKMYNFDWS